MAHVDNTNDGATMELFEGSTTVKPASPPSANPIVEHVGPAPAAPLPLVMPHQMNANPPPNEGAPQIPNQEPCFDYPPPGPIRVPVNGMHPTIARMQVQMAPLDILEHPAIKVTQTRAKSSPPPIKNYRAAMLPEDLAKLPPLDISFGQDTADSLVDTTQADNVENAGNDAAARKRWKYYLMGEEFAWAIPSKKSLVHVLKKGEFFRSVPAKDTKAGLGQAIRVDALSIHFRSTEPVPSATTVHECD